LKRLPDAVLVLSRSGRIIKANAAVVKLFNIPLPPKHSIYPLLSKQSEQTMRDFMQQLAMVCCTHGNPSAV